MRIHCLLQPKLLAMQSFFSTENRSTHGETATEGQPNGSSAMEPWNRSTEVASLSKGQRETP